MDAREEDLNLISNVKIVVFYGLEFPIVMHFILIPIQPRRPSILLLSFLLLDPPPPPNFTHDPPIPLSPPTLPLYNNLSTATVPPHPIPSLSPPDPHPHGRCHIFVCEPQ